MFPPATVSVARRRRTALSGLRSSFSTRS